MNHYYVYYRVKPTDAAEAEVLVRSMQSRLACRSGIRGQLLKKRDEPDVWMEVYAHVEDPARFEPLLLQAVEEFDLDMFSDAPRKLECFTGEAASERVCARPA